MFGNLMGIPFERIPLILKLEKFDFTSQVVFVTSLKNQPYFAGVLESVFGGGNVVSLEFFNSEIYEKVFCDPKIFLNRAKALNLLVEGRKRILVVSPEALSYRVPIPEYFLDKFEIQTGRYLKITHLVQKLTSFGYKRVDEAREIGQFAVRGGIVDVFVSDLASPIRVDFFGDTIESIKFFDVDSQISTEQIDNVSIKKCSEIILTEESVEIFKKKQKGNSQSVIEGLETGYCFNGIEWNLPYFHNETATVLNYLDRKAKFIFDFEVLKLNTEFFGNKIKSDDIVFENTIDIILKNYEYLEANPFGHNPRTKEINREFNIRIPSEKTKFLNALKKGDVVSLSSQGAFFILESLLPEINLTKSKTFFEKLDDGIEVVISPLKKGFKIGDISIYSEQELFGERLKARVKQDSKNILRQYSKLSVGDYVVHENHGVAIFEGMKNISVSGISHDFLILLYKNNDKLYVPVENIALVSKYSGSENFTVELDQLKGGSWARRKGNVRKKLLVVAMELLQIAAKRKLQTLLPCEIDQDEYQKFCKGFGHIETDDQLDAIDDTLSDLQNSVPMDRLICGDVGFGKTEVALRAAFVVASSKRQVVLLAPTTILVSQHYKNFLKRFEEFPIKICQLSRFVPRKEFAENVEKIKNGEISIIIATHTVLSSKIEFKDLGLVIIDEEQHFGVKQKEFLKSIKGNIHFMTLSATPIPRTLQLAVSGIKDLSIIATPPVDRKPVRTVICDFEEKVVKNAIDAELKTDGQVFFVTPRVEYLSTLYELVLRLFPNISVAQVHGKSTDLEKKIQAFCDEKIKVLVSTNIIDSGIDIPNANTILVHRSDLFGLSQLYQLRGRVGRSIKQAYAYFFLPEFKVLTENSKKRIQVLNELNELGAGFTLANHDLDIRGAGNLVGEEQSGYIREVGVELYQTMLQEAILMVKSGKAIYDDGKEPQINLGIPIFIKDTYIEDSGLRLSIYRRIGEMKTEEELLAMEFELADRFGAIPIETQNLLLLMKIKIYCSKLNIEKLDVGNSGFSFSFFENRCSIRSLVEFFKSDAVKANSGAGKLRSDMKIVITKKWKSVQERSNDILAILKTIPLH